MSCLLAPHSGPISLGLNTSLGPRSPQGRPMEKRVVFSQSVLPYLLVAPQIAITLIFFMWTAR